MPRRRRPERSVREAGIVTAELAVCLPALLLVLAMLLWGVSVVAAELRCIDAARVAARVAARGEPASIAEEAGRRAAPDGARVQVTVSGDTVRVRVLARVAPPAPGVPSVPVHAVAEAALEPSSSTSWGGTPPVVPR